MTTSPMLPTALWLLQLTDEKIKYVSPVRVLDIYEGVGSMNFHPEGLYSTEIFGKVGTPERDTSFSYIDLKVTILHPKIFDDLCRLKGLYRGIMAGKETARFDEQLCDFVADNGPESGTGYAFFIAHLKKIKFKRNKSGSRQQRIDEVEKYINECTTTRVAVLPAGLRDVEVDDSGRTTKNEVHGLYTRLISIANVINPGDDLESPAYDIPRWSMTITFKEIYDLYSGILEGKNGYLYAKWGSRKVIHGTRNVLSVMDTSSEDLDAPNAPGMDATVVGLFQTIKGLTPITIHLLKTRYLDRVFAEGESDVPLINPDTLMSEYVEISADTRDRWTTKEGLISVINNFQELEARHRPVMVEGKYIALIYKGPNNDFKVFYDIRDLPDHLDAKHVTPITLCELLYLSGYDRWNKYFIEVTRYPIAGINSVYPSRVYCRTTTVAEVRYELDDNWERMGDEHVALEFPRIDVPTFVNTQSPHSTRLDGLVADFDGDTGSGTYLMTDEALQENERYLNTRLAWVEADGSMRASCNIDTVKLVVQNLTRRVRK